MHEEEPRAIGGAREKETVEDPKIKEWEAAVQEIRMMKTILLQRAIKKLGPSGANEWFVGKGHVLGEKIRKDHPDCEQYAAYHLLASGSTPFPEESPKLGLPGNYKVDDFFVEAMGELLSMEDKK
jgi:hypothetical protein